MKFWLFLLFEPQETLLEHARNAERFGFEGVAMSDHVVLKTGEKTPHPSGIPVDPDFIFPDPLLNFAAMASVTTKLRFLTNVYVVPLRDPFMLAKQMGTLALASDDRMVLGTGVGWLKEEFEAMGIDFHTRGRRMDEMLQIMRDFWDDGYAEFHGKHFDFPKSGMFPVPRRQVPMWIGGHSPAAARRAVNFDGYMPMRPPINLDTVDEETRAEFKMIDELRTERGLTGPYERTLLMYPSGEPRDADAVRRLEEVEGITNLVVVPWRSPALWGGPPETFEEKWSKAAKFAEQVIHRS